jgi:hypothetical protein
MKRKILMLFVAAIVCGEMTNAQTTTTTETKRTRISSREAKRKVVFGFKGGFNRSNVYDMNSKNFVADPKTGGVVGGFLAIPFGDFIGFMPEVLYSHKGFSGTGTINGEVYGLTRTTTHIDIPLQLQLKPFSWFSMVGGIQYSYLIRQKDEFVVGSNSEQITKEFNNDNIRKNLVGVVVGGDLNFWHIVFSARGGWDMMANHGDGTSSTPQYKNLWFQGTIGYRVY